VSRSHRCSSQSTGNERPRARDNRRENRDDLPPRHEHLLLKRTLLSVAVKHEPRVLRHRPPSPLASLLPLLEGCGPEVAASAFSCRWQAAAPEVLEQILARCRAPRPQFT
jgi:hypothetical protein